MGSWRDRAKSDAPTMRAAHPIRAHLHPALAVLHAHRHVWPTLAARKTLIGYSSTHLLLLPQAWTGFATRGLKIGALRDRVRENWEDGSAVNGGFRQIHCGREPRSRRLVHHLHTNDFLVHARDLDARAATSDCRPSPTRYMAVATAAASSSRRRACDLDALARKTIARKTPSPL